MRNKLLTVFGSVLMMAGVCFPVYASEEDVYEVGEIQSENQQLMNVDENGNNTPKTKTPNKIATPYCPISEAVFKKNVSPTPSSISLKLAFSCLPRYIVANKTAIKIPE